MAPKLCEPHGIPWYDCVPCSERAARIQNELMNNHEFIQRTTITGIDKDLCLLCRKERSEHKEAEDG